MKFGHILRFNVVVSAHNLSLMVVA